jgi:hypothetical protein
MHSFVELIDHCTAFTLDALEQANEKATSNLQVRAATPFVKTLQMVSLQKAISAAGMFSIFEAMLQESLKCSDGFREAIELLEREGETTLKDRFVDFQMSINVLKHGRGRSYDALVARATQLPFRIKKPGESFFLEGDVSEIATLIEVDDQFVQGCADVIRNVADAIQKSQPVFL